MKKNLFSVLEAPPVGGTTGMRRVIRKFPGVLLLLSLFPAAATAETSSRLFGGVELGLSTFQFDKKLDQSLVFATANFTAGMSYGRYNFLASYATSFNDAEVSEEDFFGTGDRTDLDLIAARQINKQVNVFIGYKVGETSLNTFSTDDEDGSPPSRSEYFKQEGPFVGASYTWAFEDAGRLSMSIAYADLDANNKFVSDADADDDDEEPIEFDDIDGKSSGSSKGFSYNITYTLPLRGNLLFRTKLRLNRYEQDIEHQGNRFRNIDEDSTALLTGLVYVF